MIELKQEDFVHLHVRTPYSFYEGAGRIEELVQSAAHLGQKAVAFTDRNRTPGLIEGYKTAKETGIHPVLGLLLDDPRDERYSVLFWARNLEGYGELNRLASNRQLKPDYSLTEEIKILGQGVIAATSHTDLLEILREVLPPGSIYGELTSVYNDTDRKQTRMLYDFCKGQKIPMVVTGSVGFAVPSQKRLHHLLRAIGKRQVLRKTAKKGEILTRPLDDGGKLLQMYRNLPEAVFNSRLIAEQCEVDLRLGTLKFPQAILPAGRLPFEELRSRTEEGLRRRYGQNPSMEARRRLAYELGVIDHLGFTSYILVVHDIARDAWSKGVRTLGRGSAGNSIVCYCLQLTDICPLKYNLYFERFLNPERTSPPDIDLDFSWRDRDEVLHKVYETYGDDRVAMISTHVTFAARAAIRESALARGIPEDEISRITRYVPHFTRVEKLADLKTEVPECSKLPFDREPWSSIVQDADGLLKLPRHLSIHCGGIVISPDPITKWTALEMAAKGFVVTQYDMYGIEHLGLVKIDLLSQRALGVLKDAVINIEANTGKRPPVDHVEYLFRDKKTWNDIRNGDTMGVFYVESPGMRALQKKLDCDHYVLLVAASSVIRPGVSESGMMQQFIERVRDPSKASYLHPKMKDLLGETYGVMIYQEDVIKVAHHIAGISLGKADSLRRAMSGKYRSHDEMEKVQAQFLEGCRQNGVSRGVAEEIWRQVYSFAGYSFCKAHSASFAVLSVQIAYLRAHHPAEFMAGVLANGGGYYSQAAYVEEARRMGLDVRTPHVNHSGLEHTGRDNVIQLGLRGIGVLHDETPDRIIEEREKDGPFTGLGEFIRRVNVNRDEAEGLICCGALDGFAENRPTLLRNLRAGFRAMKQNPGPLALQAEDIFSSLPDAPDWDDMEKYAMQRQILGFSTGPHPLSLLNLPLRGVTLAREMEQRQGRNVVMVGWAYAHKRIATRNSKENMEFISLEDLTGTFEATVFPRVYKRYATLLKGPGPYRIIGRVEDEQGVCTLIASGIEKVLQESVIDNAHIGRNDELARAWSPGKGKNLRMTG